MDIEAVQNDVAEALNPEEFDVLDYMDGAPVIDKDLVIYRDVAACERLVELAELRRVEIAQRRAAAQRGESPSLAISDADEDTEYDDEINELVDRRENTRVIFKTKSVAPALEKAIKKSYRAKANKDATPEEAADYEDRMYADILTRAIDYVVTGDGREDRKPWDPDRLEKFREKLYAEQSEILLAGLTRMVYTGQVFEDSLTADFS